MAALAAGCGRKGPPLPPLVRVPAAPAEFVAERRGNTVEIAFRVPDSNTDRTRPANIERIDIYGYSGPSGLTDGELIRRGDRIGSVDVKTPADPDQTIEPDEPASDIEPLQGPGLDQGAATRLFEELTDDLVRRGDPPGEGPGDAIARQYVSVAISTGGRPGPFSRRAAVPLDPAPPPPSQPRLRYDETAVTVAWDGPGADESESAGKSSEADAETPSRPAIAYHVYEVRVPAPGSAGDPRGAQPSSDFETRLTASPVSEQAFVDRRIEWGAERCYTVRTVRSLGALFLESDPSAPACVTLEDTFPPAAPGGLAVVASEGAINLIWDRSAEADLAGYLVLRRPAAGGDLTAIMPAPIQETTFTDRVPPGTSFIYAVQAVDRAENKSAPSTESAPETAR
jgi:hypothetical protein